MKQYAVYRDAAPYAVLTGAPDFLATNIAALGPGFAWLELPDFVADVAAVPPFDPNKVTLT